MSANYVFTPARRASLRKAQLASAANRRGKSVRANHRIYGQTKNRPQGVKGLKATFTPYVRANKRSQTAGFNAGTIIPGTHKRIAIGSYARIENTTRKSAVDRAINKATYKYVGKNNKRSKVSGYLKKNVRTTVPAVRVSVGGAQARLGTSRNAGPTVIVRRGTHKAPTNKTQTGLRTYDKTTEKRKTTGKKRKQRRSQ